MTVTITDDDTAGATISETELTIDEGATATYTVVLDTQPTGDVTVTVNDPSNTDITASPESLTFTPDNWDEEQTVTVTAVDDEIDDDSETMTLTHTVASPDDSDYDGIKAGSVDVSITDNDAPAVTVSFASAMYTAPEGGSVQVQVTLSQTPERQVTIPITKANQGGASNSDYSGVPASLTFGATDTEKTITFSATDDNDNDDGEKVELRFGTLPAGVTAGATTTVTITDDDDPTVNVRFGNGTYTVAEGGTQAIKIILNVDPERTITFPLTRANQDGATSADYTVPASVTFNSGDTEKTITFAAAQDTLDDDDEKVKLGFGPMPTGALAVNPTQATVSITDDDDPQVIISFASAMYTAPEGGSVQVKVTLSQTPERQVTIPITKANQGGASNSDYSGVPASLIFGATDTEKTFTFTATDDSSNDDGGVGEAGLRHPARRGNGWQHCRVDRHHHDNDDPWVTARFERSTYSVDEGGTVQVTVTLSKPTRSVRSPSG